MKKFLLSLVAALAMGFMMPQTASAKIHRMLIPLDDGWFAQVAINDQTGETHVAILDVDTWESEDLM